MDRSTSSTSTMIGIQAIQSHTLVSIMVDIGRSTIKTIGTIIVAGILTKEGTLTIETVDISAQLNPHQRQPRWITLETEVITGIGIGIDIKIGPGIKHCCLYSNNQ